MRTVEQANAMDIVSEITGANLFGAYISIEEEKAESLIQYLREKKVNCSYASWNNPESIYVGDGKPTGKLVVIALNW